jgi:RNA binding exosome subunit
MLNDSYVKCRDKIEEAFQSYMRIINEVKVDLLASLEKNRDDKQEFLNTLYQKIDKQTTLLQDALG